MGYNEDILKIIIFNVWLTTGISFLLGMAGGIYIEKSSSRWFRICIRLGNLEIYMITLVVIIKEIRGYLEVNLSTYVYVIIYVISFWVTMDLLICRSSWLYQWLKNRKRLKE